MKCKLTATEYYINLIPDIYITRPLYGLGINWLGYNLYIFNT